MVADALCKASTATVPQRQGGIVCHSHHIAIQLAQARIDEMHRAAAASRAGRPPRRRRRWAARRRLAIGLARAFAPATRVRRERSA
jgi:hypothetical protein